MSLLNVEIKARCKEPERIRSILENHEADFIGADHQRDTYFKVDEGRLKLREGIIENNLIYYERADAKEPEASEIELMPVPKKQGNSLKKLLTQALGTWVTVDKKREIYFIDNVKFHIDEVQHLGSFVEIEAIDEVGSRNRRQLHEQCRKYMQLLHIDEANLIDGSYSDMLAKSNQP